MDGVPVILPALTQAQEYQDRAARIGFDWNQIGDVLDKVKEEIERSNAPRPTLNSPPEIGDLFFVLIN
ncbi:MAG: hypothetical protein U0X93_09590 [Anaerolineales bacterium]